METKDKKALSELRRLTECCICLMPFTDPRMLPCIHSACLKCFEDIQTKNTKIPGEVIPCPVCRTEFTIPPTGMSGLQKNFFIANLLGITQNFSEETKIQLCKMCKIIDAQKDVSEVTMKCLECNETFCERCANVHKYSKFTQTHRIVEVKGNLSEEEILIVLPPPSCPNHPLQVLNYYCADCKTVVCVSCFVEKHKSHDCKDVTTVDKDFRESLENSSTKMLHYIAQMEAKRSKMESRKTKLLEQTSEIEIAIRLKNRQLKALVDQHTNRVLNDLSSIKQKYFKNLETEIDEIEFKMSILQTFEKYCCEIKSKGSPNDVCSCVDGLIRRSDELKIENDEYLDRPDSVVEVKFNATDQHLLIESFSNVIGQIEDSTSRIMSSNESASFFNNGKENISSHRLPTAIEPSSPPPPPLPPLYPSNDPSSTASDNVPCPSYSTSGHPYAASHTGGRQMHYQPPLQQPGVPYGTANPQQVHDQQVFVVGPQPPVIVVSPQPRVSMVGAIVLSCVVFRLFGWLFGGVAFVLALIGQSYILAGDRQTAIRLRNASYAVSIAGVFVAIIFIIVVVLVSLTSVKNTYDYVDDYCYSYASHSYYRC